MCCAFALLHKNTKIILIFKLLLVLQFGIGTKMSALRGLSDTYNYTECKDLSNKLGSRSASFISSGRGLIQNHIYASVEQKLLQTSKLMKCNLPTGPDWTNSSHKRLSDTRSSSPPTYIVASEINTQQN